MWIEVRDAPKPLWIDTDECRLPDGELAFAYENLQKPAIPTWFAAPPASTLRGSSEELWAWYDRQEHRSLRGTVREVLTFYEASIAQGGLAKEEYTRSRAGAGFSADNRKKAFFNLDLCQHRDVVFWTVEFGVQICEPKQQQPLSLLFKNADEQRVVLKHPKTSEEYWIPSTSLRDSRPHPDVRHESVLWSSLPSWLQFDIESGQSGNACYVRHEDGVEESDITVVTPLGSNGDMRFESCLNSLDDHGFDGSGLERPSHCYHVSLAVNGRYRYAHISSESGERALVGLHSNPDEPILFVRYYPSTRSTSQGRP
jgi:hypothetical protein